MSTKTTFKRIALVAVAALGLGVLSVAPSSATVTGLTVTVADGTAKLAGAATDSTTAATINIQGILNQYDSVTVSLVEKAKPAGSTPITSLSNADSATSTMASTQILVDSVTAATPSAATSTAFAVKETSTTGSARIIQRGSAAIFFNQNFKVYLETPTSTRVAGTYTWTVMVKSYDSSSNPTSVIAKDISIVIAAALTADKVPSALTSFANLTASGTTGTAAGTAKASSDAVNSVVATAGTNGGYIFVGNRNDADGYAAALDSLTATVTGAGVVCATTGFASPTVGTCGKSIKVAATGDYQFAIQADYRWRRALF
jgi:hypothetical protein